MMNIRCIMKKVRINTLVSRYSTRSIIYSNSNSNSNTYNNTYNNDNNNNHNNNNDDLRNKILKYSLLYVKDLGWTKDALVKGMQDALIEQNSNSSNNDSNSSSNNKETYSSIAHAIVSRGPTEMIELFIENKRIHVSDIMKNNNDNNDNNNHNNNNDNDNLIYINLNKALNAHIDYLGPYIHTWSDALALMAEPRQIPNSITIMNNVLVDLIEYSNIKSKRLEWYSERLLLLSVYSSVELYMITDNSENFNETRSFLERLLNTYIDLRKSSNYIALFNRMIFK